MITVQEDTINKTINGIYVNDNMLVKKIEVNDEVVSEFAYLPNNASFRDYFTRTGSLEYGSYGMNDVIGFPMIADNITAEGTGTLMSKYLCNYVQTRFVVNESDPSSNESGCVSLKEDTTLEEDKTNNTWGIKVVFSRDTGNSNICVYNGSTLVKEYNTTYTTSSMYIILVEMQIFRTSDTGNYTCQITVVNDNNGSILGTLTIDLPQDKKCGAVLYYEVSPMGSANPNIFYIYSRPKFNLDYLSKRLNNESAISGDMVGPEISDGNTGSFA